MTQRADRQPHIPLSQTVVPAPHAEISGWLGVVVDMKLRGEKTTGVCPEVAQVVGDQAGEGTQEEAAGTDDYRNKRESDEMETEQQCEHLQSAIDHESPDRRPPYIIVGERYCPVQVDAKDLPGKGPLFTDDRLYWNTAMMRQVVQPIDSCRDRVFPVPTPRDLDFMRVAVERDDRATRPDIASDAS